MTATTRIIAGPCVTPIIGGDVARVVELANGSGRFEMWKKGVGWVTAPTGYFTLDDFWPLHAAALDQRCHPTRMPPRGLRPPLDRRAGNTARPHKDRRPDQRTSVEFGLPPDGARARLAPGQQAVTCRETTSLEPRRPDPTHDCAALLDDHEDSW